MRVYVKRYVQYLSAGNDREAIKPYIVRVAKTKLSFCLICQLWRRRWQRWGDTGAISFLSRTTTGTDITDTPMTSDRRICQFLSLTRCFILSFFLHRAPYICPAVYTPAKYPTNVSAHIIRMCSTVLKSRCCQWLANITSAYCPHPSTSFSSPSHDTAASLALSRATHTLPGFLWSRPPRTPSHTFLYHDHSFCLYANIDEGLKPY